MDMGTAVVDVAVGLVSSPAAGSGIEDEESTTGVEVGGGDVVVVGSAAMTLDRLEGPVGSMLAFLAAAGEAPPLGEEERERLR